jgi:polysaccharide export outer membrane protein
MRSLIRICLLLLAIGPASLSAQTNPDRSASQSVLTPGDSVRIVVWRRPDFSGDFAVASDGGITHPLYRTVKVAGVPYATAEANLRTFLSRFEENPQFVMEPLVRIAVIGEVNRPQTYSVRPETSVTEAVARAGGIRTEGQRNWVKVLRLTPGGAQQELRVDLNRPEGGTALTPVRSGDVIVVERQKSFVNGFLLPAFGVIGSVASIGLLIDRMGNNR